MNQSGTSPVCLLTRVAAATQKWGQLLLTLCTLLGSARSALAADGPPARATATATPQTQGQSIDPSRYPLTWRVWPLFDPFVSRQERAYAFGKDQLWSSQQSEFSAWRFAFGQTVTTPRSAFWVTLERDFALRVAERTTLMAELSRYRYLAGVHVLGLEVGVGAGLVPLGVDYTRGHFGLSLSPSSQLRVGLKIKGLRISLDAYQQYSWRWIGSLEDLWIRGFSIELAVEQPRVVTRASHPLIFEY